MKNRFIIAVISTTLLLSVCACANSKEKKDEKEDKDIMKKIAPYFRPEFLNRFNAVIEFSHLTKEDLKQSVDYQSKLRQ